MLNLKELSERYKDVGLGYIRFGGHSYYEVNSDIPLKLNSYGGKEGFILNSKGEAQIFEIVSAPFLYFNWEKEITSDEYYDSLDEINNDSKKEGELGLRLEHDSIKRWWGKTLDQYYPHPWYPEKEIIAFELIADLPYNRKGVFIEVVCAGDCHHGELGWIELTSKDGSYDFTVTECLDLPEYFKPLY